MTSCEIGAENRQAFEANGRIFAFLTCNYFNLKNKFRATVKNQLKICNHVASGICRGSLFFRHRGVIILLVGGAFAALVAGFGLCSAQCL